MENVLAIVTAAAVDRWSQYVPVGKYLARCRTVKWFKSYLAKMMSVAANMGITQGYVTALILFAPLCLSILFLQALTSIFFGPLIKFLFFAVILLYYLGNDEVGQNDSEFVTAHERNFGILFWFALLGPVGSLLYWFLVLSRQSVIINEQSHLELTKALEKLHAICAWAPARITGFVYALVGNFSSGFNCWKERMHAPALQSSVFLDDCGKASVDNAIPDDAQNLVMRAFIAWVVLSILIVVVK